MDSFSRFESFWALAFGVKWTPQGVLPTTFTATNLNSGDMVEGHGQDLHNQPDFLKGDKSLIVGWDTALDLACFIKLGWPFPAATVDLQVEYRLHCYMSGLPPVTDLRDTLDTSRLILLDHEASRDLAEICPAFNRNLDSSVSSEVSCCRAFVRELGHLFTKLRCRINLDQALFRGRYLCVVAEMENLGIPVDEELCRFLFYGGYSLLRIIAVDCGQPSVPQFASTIDNELKRAIDAHRPHRRPTKGRRIPDDETILRGLANKDPRVRNLVNFKTLVTT